MKERRDQLKKDNEGKSWNIKKKTYSAELKKKNFSTKQVEKNNRTPLHALTTIIKEKIKDLIK